jgi:hypothetical protein
LPRLPASNAVRETCASAAGIDRDRAAKARTDHADAIGIDGGMLCKERQRIAEVLNLFETDDAAELAFALAAAAHVKPQRDVAEFAEHSCRL